MRARRHPRRELRDTERASGTLEFALQAQLLGHGEHIDALLRGAEALYGGIYLLVCRLVERFGLQYVTDGGIGVLLEHQGTEHGLLEVVVAGGHTAPVVEFRDMFGLACTALRIVLWHIVWGLCVCKVSEIFW